MTFSIRFATSKDLPAIQAIYNHQIQSGNATWHTHPKDLKDYQHWFEQLKQHDYPIFVIEEITRQKIVGFAEYSAFRVIDGFKQTVEHSVYIDPQFSRRGLGKQLLQHLIEHARQHQVKVMVAAIDHENLASIALHQQFGFIQTGYMPQVGQKFGQWRDLVLMQLNVESTQPNST